MATKKSARNLPEGFAEQLFEKSPLGICIVAKDKIEVVNDRFCQLLSINKKTLVGKSLSTIFEDPVEREKIRKQNSFSKSPVDLTDNIPIEIAIHPSEFKDAKGNKKTLIYADWILSHIKEDPELEDLNLAFNLSPSLVLILDEKTNIININDTALRIVKASKRKSLGLQPGNVLRCFHSHDSVKGCGYGPDCKKCLIRETFQDTLKNGKDHLHIETPFVYRENGTDLEITVQLSTIAFHKENKRYVLVCIDDITKQKELERILRTNEQQLQDKNFELKALNTKLLDSYAKIKHMNSELKSAIERAEESDKLKSAFLANLSHEVRTPLNGILGFIDLLSDHDPQSEKAKKFRDIINKNADQLLQIVNDVLEISHIETRQVKLNARKTDLHELLQALYVLYKPKADEKSLDFKFISSKSSDYILKADFIKLNRIFQNLIQNAIKFTNTGSVEFGFLDEDKHVQFFVKDTGIGIEKSLLKKVFERFRQAELDEARIYSGLGLGLPIARAFVELHGGSMWVDSVPGKGTTFFFTIPKELKEPPEVESPAENSDLNIKKKRTILIVEDEEYNMLFLMEILKNSGITILTASDGQEAIELCEKHPEIDLVLMDIKLPFVDGYTATRKIKLRRKQLPIIAHTAYAMVKDKEKALEAGCDEYIPKPTHKKEMLSIIQKYL
jgi:signal transduction histidine kinase